ncbi:MAG: 16S rRNA pseudouridine(516) synthase [Tenericutes bacterium HGW-Tenericutes-3]|nr:MAG: 16S rRNA pseudouridine(516) synthase [Tenericutes bacterium HGW-Tenericutes-3]
MRIDKFLSNLKYGSRSEIKEFLKSNEISVDGIRIFSVSFEIDPLIETIYMNGSPIFYKYPIYLAINKPIGYLSANHDKMYPCVVDLLKEPYNRFDYAIAGRLDLDAEGLMVLTTDGAFAHQITLPKSHVPKTYEVTLNQAFKHHDALCAGVMIKDGKNEIYKATAIAIKSKDEVVTITIDEGKFHQIKRMFESVGYLVVKLRRTHIGHLYLGDLPEGAYKEFKKEELYD